MLMGKFTKFRDEFEFDHVHEVKVYHIENLQCLVFRADSSKAQFITGKSASCNFANMRSKCFNKLYTTLDFLPKL